MAAEFPTSVANFTNPNPVTDDLDTAVGGLTHSGQHGKVNDEIEATQTKIGTGSSTPTSGKVLRGTGAGTSGWGQITNADVDAAADIVETKIKKGSNSTVLQTDASGVVKWATATSAMIADDSIVDADIKSNADITETKLKKGSASTVLTTSSGNAIAWGTVTSAMVSTTAGIYAAQTDASVARQNLIVNGSFRSWSRGAGPHTTDGGEDVDGFITYDSTSTHSVSRATNTDAASPGLYMATMTYTHGGAGKYCIVNHTHNDYQSLKGRTVTLSVRVKSTVAGMIRMRIADGVSTLETSTNATTDWETLTYTAFPVDANATQLVVSFIVTGANCTVSYHNLSMHIGSYAIAYPPLSPGLDAASVGLTRGWTAFTPTFTQSGAVSVTVNKARYLIIDKLAHVHVNVTANGTTSGTAGNNLVMTVPLVLTSAASIAYIGSGWIWDASATTGYAVVVLMASTTTMQFAHDAQSTYVGNAPNVGITTSDTIQFSVTYELA